MFSWDDVPGNHSSLLLDFLKNNERIEWIGNAGIEEIDDGKAIAITKGRKLLIFKLNKEENNVGMETSRGKTHKYFLEEEKDKLIIYVELQ